MADHALDAIAFAIDRLVPADRFDSVGFRWDCRTDAVFLEPVSNGVGVIAFVGEEIARLHVAERIDVFERGAVGRFARREVEGERDSFGVTETVNFTGEPAPRAAKSLSLSPPFAPAAETWPRTVVESML